MAKKKEAHHGGAWKVAYADFVTAMMALFMVLWISAQDKKILISTSRYFQNPFKSPLESHSGVMPFDQQKETKNDEDEKGSKQNDSLKKVDLAFLNSVAKDFYRLLNLEDADKDKPLDIQVTSDGLRVVVFDRDKRPVFKGDTAEFTEWGKFVMQNLAWLIDRHHFFVVIEGHTKAQMTFASPDYSSWELSTDRANASRRLLTYYAVDPNRIDRVSGFADTQPLDGVERTDEANQRVSLSLSVVKHAADEKHGAPGKAAAITKPASVPSS